MRKKKMFYLPDFVIVLLIYLNEISNPFYEKIQCLKSPNHLTKFNRRPKSR